MQRLFNLQSGAFGFLISELLCIFLLYKKKLIAEDIKKYFIIITIIFLINLIILISRSFYYEVDYLRYFLSLILFLTTLITISVFIQEFDNISNKDFDIVIKITLLIFLISIIFGYFNINIFNDDGYKSIGLFKEPSHFAIYISPFLMTWFINKKNIYIKWVFYILLILFSFHIESLTLIIVLFLSLPLLMSFRGLVFCLIIIISLIIILPLIINIPAIDVSYYFHRIPIPGSENSTNYYYFQSIEELFLALKESYLMGLGFQQLGISEPGGEYARILLNSDGFYTVRYEAAAFFYKLSSEFGLIGLLLSLVYLYYLVYACINLFIINIDYIYNNKYSFVNICIYSSFIYFFIRGSGYFNLIIILTIFSMIKLNSINRSLRSHA